MGRGRKRKSRSGGRPAGSDTSLQSEIARALPPAAGSGTSPPTPTQKVEASGSQSTLCKRRQPRFRTAPVSSKTEEEMPVLGSASAAVEADVAEDQMRAPTAGEEVDATNSTEETAAGAFVPISPIRVPRFVEYDSSGEELCERSLSPDRESYEVYLEAERKYSEKIGQLRKLATLDRDTAFNPETIQESVADTILEASKFVFGLSSHIDGVLLEKCSGILMKWEAGTGTIVTTTRLFCSSSPNLDDWLGGQEYALKAEVLVEMHMDDSVVKGELIYLDKQYGFALINAPMDEPAKLPDFSKQAKPTQHIYHLGRCKSNLTIGYGKVMWKGAGAYHRHHFMFTDGHIYECGAGGAVIDLEGDVIGMAYDYMAFIPSSTFLKCLHLWSTFDHVPRIHLGMKLFGIKCLNLVSREKISRKHNVNAGLIIVEVSAGSSAEELGLRMGDIILHVNGEFISTAVELENMLLDVCKDYLEKQIGIDTDVDVMVELGVFNIPKGVCRKIQLMAKLSHSKEIITRGKLRIYSKNPSMEQALQDRQQ